MKIVHIITGLTDGGAEGALYRLVTHDQDNEHIVVSMMDASKYGPMLEDQGIKVYCLNMITGRLSPKPILKLYKILKKIKPDIVQTWMYHADLVGGVTAKLLGNKKIFWNIRQSNFDSNHTKSSTIKTAKINARLSNFIPKKIISCSKNAVRIHEDIGYDFKKIAVIGNGYDLNAFKINDNARDAIRNELNIGKHPVLGMIGRYDPQKNHTGLIEALKMVKENGYIFDLLLVGRDLNEKNNILIRQLKEAELYEQTHLLGQRDDIASIMNALDIHILSSSYGEGFPNVLAEAMACGTPCIATDVGDSKFIIGSYGTIVEPNINEEISLAVMKNLELMKNERKWHDLRLSGRDYIVKNFSIQSMVSNYQNVWKGN